jgi:Fe2+ or Zn2+ uptake regulation protein
MPRRPPASSFADRAEAALRVRGGRMTRSRRALLELLGSAGRPLSPGELQRELRRRGAPLDRVSVYRNVAALLELGLVHRVLGSAAVRPCEGQEAPQPARCHHAVVCSSCGAASEFHSAAVERALREVRRATGYLVQEHLLELRGLCPRCARTAP